MSNPEQPIPKPNNSPHVIDLAISLIESRREVGRQRYGTPLQIGNGRDFGRDADEEMADWIIYWAGYREEHAKRIRELLAMTGRQSEEIKSLRGVVAGLLRAIGSAKAAGCIDHLDCWNESNELWTKPIDAAMEAIKVRK